MFSFSKPMNPALSSHLDSQVAFYNDLSKSMSGAFQSICEANLKLSQTMLEEILGTAQRILTTTNVGELFEAATSGAQPASDQLRSYQQHMSRLAADAQVDLSRVTQQHGAETSRTAQALVDEVGRVTAEESERSLRQKEEFLKNFRDPFQQDGSADAEAGLRAKAGARSAREGVAASMQSAGEAVFAGAAQSTRPAQHPGAQQPGNKQSGTPK
jgi:phasin family protein